MQTGASHSSSCAQGRGSCFLSFLSCFVLPFSYYDFSHVKPPVQNAGQTFSPQKQSLNKPWSNEESLAARDSSRDGGCSHSCPMAVLLYCCYCHKTLAGLSSWDIHGAPQSFGPASSLAMAKAAEQVAREGELPASRSKMLKQVQITHLPNVKRIATGRVCGLLVKCPHVKTDLGLEVGVSSHLPGGKPSPELAGADGAQLSSHSHGRGSTAEVHPSHVNSVAPMQWVVDHTMFNSLVNLKRSRIDSWK